MSVAQGTCLTQLNAYLSIAPDQESGHHRRLASRQEEPGELIGAVGFRLTIRPTPIELHGQARRSTIAMYEAAADDHQSNRSSIEAGTEAR